MKKRVAVVSACLLGETCRYDGKTKTSHAVIRALKNMHVIAFCPEVHDLGLPREKIHLYQEDGMPHLLQEPNDTDVTPLIRARTFELMAHVTEPAVCVLKSKSPSCALNSVAHYTKYNDTAIGIGDGVAATLLRKQWQHTIFYDENSLHV